jgi:hypothetical protein
VIMNRFKKHPVHLFYFQPHIPLGIIRDIYSDRFSPFTFIISLDSGGKDFFNILFDRYNFMNIL